MTLQLVFMKIFRLFTWAIYKNKHSSIIKGRLKERPDERSALKSIYQNFDLIWITLLTQKYSTKDIYEKIIWRGILLENSSSYVSKFENDFPILTY